MAAFGEYQLSVSHIRYVLAVKREVGGRSV